jgi:uncharacterized membrane protein
VQPNYGYDNQQGAGRANYERLAKGLGWFSIGLGLAEVAAPGTIAKLIGIADDEKNRMLLRSPVYGMRELGAGAGILSTPQPAGWMWSRVAGDILDLGSLAAAYNNEANDRKRVMMGIAAVLGVTVLDVLCAQGLSASEGEQSTPSTTKAITLNKSPQEVYAFWRNFENLPRFMRHLESVHESGGNRSLWRAVGPAGKIIQWEAEITQDEPNRLIAWQSLPGADVQNSGRVTFEPGFYGRGTIVKVEVAYDPPGGAVGAMVAKLFGKDANQMLDDDLRAFKQIMEIGEIVNSDASIHSKMHPAQPPRMDERTLTIDRSMLMEKEYA